eukprot:CAMPEP_0175093608 /NCGR_PEP_ID=MMETSP0086_2-20121207/3116_1 /TAXON_ID=136419 /ORGANISM="Unknown Unknown, Strain D1" /LENGTH=161 /DNA_ID=CAMNT_0016366607 /DNA_START=97 /DNA_END=583 /DNA_ORIENTATION=+
MTAQDRMKALKAAAMAKRNAKLKNNSAMMRTQTDAPSWNTNNRPMSKQRARPQSNFAPPGGKGFGGNSRTSSRPQSRTESEKDGDEDYEDQPSGHKWQGQIGAAPEDRDFPEQQQRQAGSGALAGSNSNSSKKTAEKKNSNTTKAQPAVQTCVTSLAYCRD